MSSNIYLDVGIYLYIFLNLSFYFRNGTRPEGNPFEEEEWDEDPGEVLVDNGEPGVPVRALYDYEGAESDELSFKQGNLVLNNYTQSI